MSIVIRLKTPAGELNRSALKLDPQDPNRGNLIREAVVAMLGTDDLLPGDTITIEEEDPND